MAHKVAGESGFGTIFEERGDKERNKTWKESEACRMEMLDQYKKEKGSKSGHVLYIAPYLKL